MAGEGWRDGGREREIIKIDFKRGQTLHESEKQQNFRHYDVTLYYFIIRKKLHSSNFLKL